jgi:transcriptional regulator with XRE-family HTH domain
VIDGVALSRPGVGDFVALLRRRRKMSQRTLSTLIGRSPAYVHKIETGQLDPSLRGFAAVAMALEMNPLEVWVVMRLAAIPVTPLVHDGRVDGNGCLSASKAS